MDDILGSPFEDPMPIRLATRLLMAVTPVILLAAPSPRFAFRKPNLAPEGTFLSAWTYQCGNMKAEFKDVVVTPILVDGVPQGLYLQGPATFTYTVKAPSRRAVATYNVKGHLRVTPTETPEGVTFSKPVEDAILWHLGPSAPTLPAGERRPAPTEAFTRFHARTPASVETGLQHWAAGRGWVPLGFLAAFRQAHEPQTPVVVLDMGMGTKRLAYTHDPVFSHTQSLRQEGSPEKFDSWHLVEAVSFDESPLAWPQDGPPNPDALLTHLDMDFKGTRGAQASYRATEHYTALRGGLRVLILGLESTSKDSKGPLGPQVNQVLLDGKTPLSFHQEGASLLVDLERPRASGEKFQLTFDVSGQFLDHEDGDRYWRLVPGQEWFPVPQKSGQSYTVKVRTETEKPEVIIASAATLRRSATDTHTFMEAASDKPINWFSLAGGAYEPVELSKDGITVRAWAYGGLGHGASRLLSTAHGMLGFYRDLYGDLPFAEVNLVQFPVFGHGQAPPGMIWLSNEAFDAISDPVNRYFASFGVGGWVNRMVAHELGHLYWGNKVKIWDSEDNWISEAFAEYSSALAMRAMKRKGKPVFDLIIKDYEKDALEATESSSILGAYLLATRDRMDGKTGSYRRSLLYAKGPLLLARLHEEMGEDAFIRFLRTYQKTFGWKTPSLSQDAPLVLKAITGKDHGDWFRRYLEGTQMPPMPGKGGAPQQTPAAP